MSITSKNQYEYGPVSRRDFLFIIRDLSVLAILTACGVPPSDTFDDETKPDVGSNLPETNTDPEQETITNISDIDFAVALGAGTDLALTESRARQLVLYQTGIKTKGIKEFVIPEQLPFQQPPRWGMLKGTMTYSASEPFAIFVDLNVDPIVDPYSQYRWMKVALGPQEAILLEQNVAITKASLQVSGFTLTEIDDMVKLVTVTHQGAPYTAMVSKHFGQSLTAMQKAGATIEEISNYYNLAAVRGYQLYKEYRFFQWDPNFGNVAVRPLPDGRMTVIVHDFTNARTSTKLFSNDFAERIRRRFYTHAHRHGLQNFPQTLAELETLAAQNPIDLPPVQNTVTTQPVGVISNGAVTEVVGAPSDFIHNSTPVTILDDVDQTVHTVSPSTHVASEIIEDAATFEKRLTLIEKTRLFASSTKSILTRYAGPMLQVLGFITTIEFLRQTFDPTYANFIAAKDAAVGQNAEIPNMPDCAAVWQYLSMRKPDAYKALHENPQFVQAITQTAQSLITDWNIDALETNIVQQVANAYIEELEVTSNLGALRLDLYENGSGRQTQLYICANTSEQGTRSLLFYTLQPDANGNPAFATPIAVSKEQLDGTWQAIPVDGIPQQFYSYWNKGETALGNQPGPNRMYELGIENITGKLSIIRRN